VAWRRVSSWARASRRLAAELILLLVEDGVFDRLARAGGFGFLERLDFVEPLDEEQVRELLDNRQRVGYAAGPHRVPDAVDFGFKFADDHGQRAV